MNKERKPLVIVSESVIGRDGKYLGNDPKMFPVITNRCKAMLKSAETGAEYQIV